MIKIKAKYNCLAGRYKKGDVFQAKKDEGCYLFRDSHGHDRMRVADEFNVIADEPVIEVGSEWVRDNCYYEVTAIGKHSVMLYSHETNSEFACHIVSLEASYTPKPKTVTMYFYESMGRITALDYKTHAPVLFTREIELP